MLNLLWLSFYIIPVLFSVSKRDLLVVSLAAIFSVMIPPQLFEGGSTVALFCAMSATYGAASLCTRNVFTTLSTALMAMYCLAFALDTWINAYVETWIYNNHEFVVIFLHIIIVLSVIKGVQNKLTNVIVNISDFSFTTASCKKLVCGDKRGISKEASKK